MTDTRLINEAFDLLPDGFSSSRNGEGGKCCLRVVRRANILRPDSFSECVSNFICVATGIYRRAVNASPTTVCSDTLGHNINVVVPVVNTVIPQQYF